MRSIRRKEASNRMRKVPPGLGGTFFNVSKKSEKHVAIANLVARKSPSSVRMLPSEVQSPPCVKEGFAVPDEGKRLPLLTKGGAPRSESKLK